MCEDTVSLEGVICPIPLPHQESIVMGHGSGGKMTHDLVRKVFFSRFLSPILQAGDDSGVFSIPKSTDEQFRFALTTDSHVVFPLFFPGGDIGRLAICGTVNDLAVMGAVPLYLTAGFILEEGITIATLKTIADSMGKAAQEAGVQVIAGDTKVVQKGKGDGLYINTSGIGIIPNNLQIHGANARPNDVVIVSGSIGEHGIAVLAARGELGLQTSVASDVAPLNGLIREALNVSNNIHVLRDPTRGGLASTLNEIVKQSKVGILLNESAIPIHPTVRATCEMLGFDPMYVANEGKIIIIVAPQDADKVLNALHAHPYGKQAAQIGKVTQENTNLVLMKTDFGSTRIVDMLAGEMLPRIC